MQDKMYVNGMEIYDGKTTVLDDGKLTMTFRVP